MAQLLFGDLGGSTRERAGHRGRARVVFAVSATVTLGWAWRGEADATPAGCRSPLL